MLAVAVALAPAEYDFGAEAPDGSAWEPFPDAPAGYPAAGEYPVNPKFLLDESDRSMVRLWSLYRRGHLPEPGGVMQQSTVMLEAFDLMEGAAAMIWDRRRRSSSRGV